MENTGSNAYWTMTPAADASPYKEFIVTSNPNIYYESVTTSHYLRPVIALLSSTRVTGNGTKTDPFVVS